MFSVKLIDHLLIFKDWEYTTKIGLENIFNLSAYYMYTTLLTKYAYQNLQFPF